jgi:hypothetical protein
MRRVSLMVFVGLVACSSESVSPLGGTDAGSGAQDAFVADASTSDGGQAADAGLPPDSGLTCESLSEAECALSNCRSKTCQDCEGRPAATLCFGTVEPSCPDLICPPPCTDLNETECRAEPNRCVAHTCPECDGGSTFTVCAGPNDPIPGCPPPHCPECAELGEQGCADSPECHRVFAQLQDECLCDAPGCCHEFVGCADGAQALCEDDNLSCRMLAPYCAGPYVISYEGFCYEGCVLAGDCDP